jgi:hypothetical protein
VRGLYGGKIIGNAVTNGAEVGIFYYDLHNFYLLKAFYLTRGGT